jgi:hypothetical protein
MSMTAGAAIRQGLSTARRVRSAVWALFLINLGLAALATLPIYQGIMRFTSHSLVSRELAQAFSYDWLTDFSYNSPGSLDRYAALIGYVGLLAILVNTVLAGGVLPRFRAPDQHYSLGGFFRDSARYAWRLLRLMVIGLVCYWLVFKLVNQKLGDAVGRWTRDSMDDRRVFLARLAVTVLVLLGLAFVNLVMDYARVKLVLEEGTSAVEAFLGSLGFSLSRLRKAATVYLLPSLCGLALLGIYRLIVPWHLIDTSVAKASQLTGWLGRSYEPATLALLFIIQQAVMFGRYWFRVATWAGEWAYYSDSH